MVKTIYPDRLKIGDEIRIVAPARSLGIVSKETVEYSKKRLEDLGFKVTFGKNVNMMDDFKSSSIEARVSDIHDAFSDGNVKMIMPVIGGFNSNQLLRYLNYDLIRNNPKILGGYSDITALQNAIYAKTGLVTYSSPAFATFGMEKGFEHAVESFKMCLMESNAYEVKASEKWSNDSWWKDQENRVFENNPGPTVINEGNTDGTLIGGNLCTLQLLHGTEYMPSLNNSILFIEDDEETNPLSFDRDLQSLIHQPGFNRVKGIVFGRFEKASNVSESDIRQIIKGKKELERIPVIINADFGHTYPMITYPIGGEVRLYAGNGKSKIEFLKH